MQEYLHKNKIQAFNNIPSLHAEHVLRTSYRRATVSRVLDDTSNGLKRKALIELIILFKYSKKTQNLNTKTKISNIKRNFIN